MKAEILAVGTELLMGQIANTNAQYISSRLPDAGIGVYYHGVVGDNPERLKQSLQLALARSDVIILTGGLGPTQDDITKETVSGVLGRKLVLDQESLGNMEDFFTRRNRKMTQNNLKQAFFPEGCTIVRNSAGTAPGCIIEDRGRIIVMLPGPPSEMKPMFEEMVMPFLESKSEHRLESVYVRVFGIGESSVEDALLDLIDGQTNPTIASYARDGEVTLRITASYPKDRPGSDLISPVVEEIKRRFGAAVFSIDNSNLDEGGGKAVDRKKNDFAGGSCTGGCWLQGSLISRVFQRF